MWLLVPYFVRSYLGKSVRCSHWQSVPDALKAQQAIESSQHSPEERPPRLALELGEELAWSACLGVLIPAS